MYNIQPPLFIILLLLVPFSSSSSHHLTQFTPNRHKIIHDKGGFKKFDLESRPNFEIVNLDEEEKKRLQKALEKSAVSDESKYFPPEQVEEGVMTETRFEEDEDDDFLGFGVPDGFGSQGPKLM